MPHSVLCLGLVAPTKLGTWVLSAFIFGLGLLAPLAAQQRLYVQQPDGKFHTVVKIGGIRPYIMENGRLIAAKGQRLALKEVEEYLPLFIDVRDKDTRPTNVSLDYGNAPVNNGVHFSAKFESVDVLDDVFLVLELEISNVGKKIFAYEIGRLEARTAKSFSADLALGQYMGSGQLDLHLFVGGSEVFQSELSEAVRAAALDRMIAKRVAAASPSAPLQPFYGTAPIYPATLRKTGLKGDAVVTLRVDSRGVVVDPVVARASEPAFGEEALAAVRQWRFVPRVQDGRAVETKVSIPFAFDPPPGDGSKG